MERLALHAILSFSRIHIAHELKEVSEAEALIVPTGFSNNLNWNVGHLIVTFDQLLLAKLGIPRDGREGWAPLYQRGTFPSEQQLPLSELKVALHTQMEKLKQIEEAKLRTPFAESFQVGGSFTIHNAEDAAQFLVWHESLHTGILKSIKRQVKQPSHE